MRYMVRTVAWAKDRQANIEVMKQQVPELEVFTDEVGDGYGLFFETCESLNKTGGIILEDDVQLCRNFKGRIEAVIEEKGVDKVINFFERPKVDLETAYIRGSNFFWMQCLYLPPQLPLKIVGYYEEFRLKQPKKWEGMATDCLVAYTLVKEKMKYWRIRPCLVQHLDFKSVIGPRSTKRQTFYFIDDLEKA